MSEVKVNKISPRSGTDVQLGDSGDTITVPSGATLDASNATTTLPATVVTTTGSQTLTNKSIDASQLTGTITPSDNTVSLAKLTATGTKDATTFLRGDNSFQEVPAGGITEADQWRVTASSSTSGTQEINSNWERVDSRGLGTLGSGMTESSGIFTFPSTGIYLVTINVKSYQGAGDQRYVHSYILTTTDNSSYNRVAEGSMWFTSAGDGGNKYGSSTTNVLFDVTNTSTHKIKFQKNSEATITTEGDTDQNLTFATFIRLGDT